MPGRWPWYLGTNHQELQVGPEEALAAIPRLATVYDEPLGDHSQLPTCLLAQMVRGEVTEPCRATAYELFLGYDYYQRCLRQWQEMRGMPRGVGALIGVTTRFAQNRTLTGRSTCRLPFITTLKEDYERKIPGNCLARNSCLCMPLKYRDFRFSVRF